MNKFSSMARKPNPVANFLKYLGVCLFCLLMIYGGFSLLMLLGTALKGN